MSQKNLTTERIERLDKWRWRVIFIAYVPAAIALIFLIVAASFPARSQQSNAAFMVAIGCFGIAILLGITHWLLSRAYRKEVKKLFGDN